MGIVRSIQPYSDRRAASLNFKSEHRKCMKWRKTELPRIGRIRSKKELKDMCGWSRHSPQRVNFSGYGNCANGKKILKNRTNFLMRLKSTFSKTESLFSPQRAMSLICRKAQRQLILHTPYTPISAIPPSAQR